MHQAMRILKINSRYTYLSDYNLILDNGLKEIFSKYLSGKQVKQEEVNLESAEIKNNIRQVGQLIFELTQDCNLRCKYCPHNGGFFFDRGRNESVMSLETAFKGIDYIHSIIKDRFNKEITVSFYGGEPLLRFDLIRQIVRYAREKFSNWKLRFSITTNGTLLNQDVIDFLILHNFSVTISLDGPVENHDAKRVYSNGKGSFDKIRATVIGIKKTDPLYFKEKVNFSVVYSNDLPLSDTFNFFLSNEEVNTNNLRFSAVDARKSDYYKRYSVEHPQLKRDLKDILKKITRKLKPNKTLETAIEKEFNPLNIKELFIKEYSTLAGACVFSSRLFLDINGKFHICEKINHRFPIGDISNGFYYEEIQKMVSDYSSVVENNCMKCKVRFLCNPCYVSFAEDGHFKIDKDFCKWQKRNILNRLKNYVRINEKLSKNPGSYSTKKRKKFHQFVETVRGPVNCAIIDFLKKDIYQVENGVIDQFNSGNYEAIKDFMNSAAGEGIVIGADGNRWNPVLFNDKRSLELLEKLNRSPLIQLEIDKGVDPEIIYRKFSDFKIKRLICYGTPKKGHIIPGITIDYHEKDFSRCMALMKVDGNFEKIDENRYVMSKIYNSCWGRKIAVTEDGKIRPCIYSTIVIGDIVDDDIPEIMKKAKQYWHITMDKVEKCRDCEMKYACFDCREIPLRMSNNLYSANPFCKYDPYKGSWEQ
jgi:uncharacterized protein